MGGVQRVVLAYRRSVGFADDPVQLSSVHLQHLGVEEEPSGQVSMPDVTGALVIMSMSASSTMVHTVISRSSSQRG